MKKFSLRVLLPAALIAILLFSTSCGVSSYERSYFAMDTVMTIKVFGEERHLNTCGKLLSDLDDLLSVTKKNSPLSRLNEEKTTTDAELVEVVKTAKELALLTDGCFDPTIYPIVKLWGFTTDSPRVPTEEEITEASKKVGYERIIVEDGVFLDGTELDFGAVGKGYATDKLRQYLVENGVKDALLNLGGNVYAMGKKDGKDWKVAVQDPEGYGYVGILTLSDKAVVTSGLYERFFEKDGKRYGHIIDPFTGYPVENEFLSVTIIGENATKCDALSTALFVMGLERAVDFLQEQKVDAIFVTKDKRVYLTEGIDALFSLDGAYKNAEKTVIRW